jgi:hypothetical protein
LTTICKNRNKTGKIPANPLFAGIFAVLAVEKPVENVENS